jgi:deazaflavin-dependent oxidoreductase (nitroreductase family)
VHTSTVADSTRTGVGSTVLGVNPLGTLVRKLGSASWFPAVSKRIVGLDGAVLRRTKGRFGLVTLASVDGLLLTTTGRRSGQQRTVPLLYVKIPEGYLVAGSNWGGEAHPAWSANLLADPAATVTVGGRTHQVTARLAEGDERDRLWPLLTSHWPAYHTYAGRAGRRIRVFTLIQD